MDESHHQAEQYDGDYDVDQPPPAPLSQYPQEEDVTGTGTTQQEYSHKWRFKWPSAKALRTFSRFIRWRQPPDESLDNLDFWRPPKPSRIICSQTISNVFITFFTAGLLAAAILQWATLDATLEETRKLTIAANMQATAATDAVKLAKTANDLTQASATASTEMAQQAFIASQRAWLGPNDAKFGEAPVAGQKLDVLITVHNTGREPARNVDRIMAQFTATPEEEGQGIHNWNSLIFIDTCRKLPEREAGQVIYPSTGFGGVTLTYPLPEKMIDEDVVTGKKALFIHGCFVYRTFDEVRHSAFCFFYKKGETTIEHLGFCPRGNYAY